MRAQPLLVETVVECDQAIAPELANASQDREQCWHRADMPNSSANLGRHDAAPERGFRLRPGMPWMSAVDKPDFVPRA